MQVGAFTVDQASELGSGGYGRVSLVRHGKTRRVYALKRVCKAHLLAHNGARLHNFDMLANRWSNATVAAFHELHPRRLTLHEGDSACTARRMSASFCSAVSSGGRGADVDARGCQRPSAQLARVVARGVAVHHVLLEIAHRRLEHARRPHDLRVVLLHRRRRAPVLLDAELRRPERRRAAAAAHAVKREVRVRRLEQVDLVGVA